MDPSVRRLRVRKLAAALMIPSYTKASRDSGAASIEHKAAFSDPVLVTAFALPPPLHGQSFVNSEIIKKLESIGSIFMLLTSLPVMLLAG